METSKTLTAVFGLLLFLYIVAFKAYQIHKHPTSKAIIYEARIAFAHWLIARALDAMPVGPQKLKFAKLILNLLQK